MDAVLHRYMDDQMMVLLANPHEVSCSLSKQTSKNFELVIVDELWQREHVRKLVAVETSTFAVVSLASFPTLPCPALNFPFPFSCPFSFPAQPLFHPFHL